MYKIAAFIEFDKRITNKILKQKKIVKKKFGNQIYLNHPVHLTLFTLNIKKINELKKIYINNIEKKSKPLFVSLTKPGIFYNDPLTGGHTFFHYIKKNKRISEIQLRHLKKINNKLFVYRKNKNLFKNNDLKKNYKKFGFPFVGNIWIPHTTVASIKNLKNNNTYIKKFLSEKIKLKCVIREIKFYRIIKDKHDFLFNVKDF
jgi:2'-5' RNA ligase